MEVPDPDADVREDITPLEAEEAAEMEELTDMLKHMIDYRGGAT